MVRAKNYETVSPFVKVMQKKLASFSGHGVDMLMNCILLKVLFIGKNTAM